MSATALPDNRIWLDPHTPGPQTRLFRRSFQLNQPPQSALLRLFAENVYHLWINGQYVARGPAQHHPFRKPYDLHEIAPLLQAGDNVIAVLVHAPGIALHNAVPAGEPGLTARLLIEQSKAFHLTPILAEGAPPPPVRRGRDGERVLHNPPTAPSPALPREYAGEGANARGQLLTIDTDADWKATADTGWSADVPRRSWAIGHIEKFDANSAPLGWQQTHFDDSAWPNAQVVQPASNLPDALFVPRPVPNLRYTFLPPALVMATYTITATPDPITATDNTAAFGKALLDADWQPADDNLRISAIDPATGAFTITGLTPDLGAVICFDLDQQYTGQIVFEADCPTQGVIDIAWAEAFENGKPWLIRKGCSYADRYFARPGPNPWQPVGYSSMRYTALILRGFEGSITFTRYGLMVSEPHVATVGHFSCDDAQLTNIWNLCARTQLVGTQEAMFDCPTREQAAYVGDGQFTGRWFTMLTGDARHWKNLVNEQFRRQAPNGLIRPSIFTGANDTLVDYTLLAVIGTRDYWRFTRDTPTVEANLPACRKALTWFERRLSTEGLCVTNDDKTRNSRSWEQTYDPSLPVFEEGVDTTHLFIDHPGMGWHNLSDAGIDRRGTNAAINALLVRARRALADLEAITGQDDRAADLRANADQLCKLIFERFWNESPGALVDGIFEGKQLSQLSEQTNTWAIAADCLDEEHALDAVSNLLTRDRPDIARNGPYFWAYLLPELARLDLHRLALDKIRVLWGNMLDNGATTLWETFAGDDLDSWCHAWSAAPLEFLPIHIAGLPGMDSDPEHPTLHPQYDFFETCSATLMTPVGKCSIEWRTEENRVVMKGSLPASVHAQIVDPEGQPLEQVTGDWEIIIPI